MTTKLPPGPRGRLLTSLRLAASPVAPMEAWSARYGDPFGLDAINGRIVVTGDPEHIATVFRGDPDAFEAFGARAIAPLVGARSLLIVAGETHRRDRKLLMPPFHGARMKAYTETMAEVAARHLERAPPETTALALGQAVSLEVILRAVLGLPPERVEALAPQIVDTVESVPVLPVFVPALQRRFGGLSAWARFEAKRDALDALLLEHIARTRRDGGGDDILSLLVAAEYEDGTRMTDETVKDELVTLLLAGHETTAISLAWAIDVLHRHPEVQDELQAEVDAAPEDPEAWSRLPLLDAVCKEILRLYPPVPEVFRTLRRPFELAGYRLEPGVTVCASAWLAHRRSELYPDPGRFQPARFLDAKPSPFAYLPFGGGHRRCLGAAFAQLELKVVLAQWLRRASFALVRSEAPRVVRRNITLAPEGGVPCRPSPRPQTRASISSSRDHAASASARDMVRTALPR